MVQANADDDEVSAPDRHHEEDEEEVAEGDAVHGLPSRRGGRGRQGEASLAAPLVPGAGEEESLHLLPVAFGHGILAELAKTSTRPVARVKWMPMMLPTLSVTSSPSVRRKPRFQ